MHASIFDSLEYLPTAHAVQMLAPVLVPVFVIEPALQARHDEALEFVEYCPAAQGMHAAAFAAAPVSVIDPGWQFRQ